MKSVVYILAAALLVLLVTACGRPSQAIPQTERGNYEKIISGEKIECSHGLDTNGNYMKEAYDGAPTRKYSC